jgi:hypothetical protein
MKLHHIRHGVEIMALSMGLSHLTPTPLHRLYEWSAKRYAKISRKRPDEPCTLETLAHLHLFYYGRDIVLKELEG